jgi:hypothetical protein
VELELQSVCKEKSTNFTVRDVPTLAIIMDAHVNTSVVVAGTPSKMVEINSLEDDTYELLVKPIKYDCQVWRVWQNKLRTWESVRYHQKLQWAHEARQTNCRAAQAFMVANCLWIHGESHGQTIQALMDFEKTIEKRLQMASGDVVACLQLEGSCKLRAGNQGGAAGCGGVGWSWGRRGLPHVVELGGPEHGLVRCAAVAGRRAGPLVAP